MADAKTIRTQVLQEKVRMANTIAEVDRAIFDATVECDNAHIVDDIPDINSPELPGLLRQQAH